MTDTPNAERQLPMNTTIITYAVRQANALHIILNICATYNEAAQFARENNGTVVNFITTRAQWELFQTNPELFINR